MSVGMRTGGLGSGGEVAPRRRPFRKWSVGHLAVVVAALLAFVANLAFLRSRDDATSVVVAARSIEAGQVVGGDDFATTMLRADEGILARLAVSPEELEGRVARRSLEEGDLVGAGDLLSGPAPGGLASMSVPTDPGRAAGGAIREGDRVDVVDVDDDGAARYVVRDVPVLAVSESGRGALPGVGQDHIVLGLESDQVLAVAAAIADGEVDIVVTTGAGNG